MHVLVRLLSQDSTFDLISFQNYFPKFELPNSGCGLSASAAYTLVFTVVVQVWTHRKNDRCRGLSLFEMQMMLHLEGLNCICHLCCQIF